MYMYVQGCAKNSLVSIAQPIIHTFVHVLCNSIEYNVHVQFACTHTCILYYLFCLYDNFLERCDSTCPREHSKANGEQ